MKTVRAHRRFPEPQTVADILATLREYDRARVYDYLAGLYSVIDGQAAQLEEKQEPDPTVIETMVKAHEARLLVVEQAIRESWKTH